MQKYAGRLFAVAVSGILLCGCGGTNDAVMRFSWWGGASRHEVTTAAAELFMQEHPGVDIRCEYGAWSGWEEASAAALYAGTEADVMQVNWNWLTDYNSEDTGFLDLYEYTDCIDTSQYDPDVLEMCTVGGKLLCIPVSETGRVFFWNEETYRAAGLDVPGSFSALCDAGEVFREKLGEDYYPLALGWYDRMLFLVYLLQSKYGREWVKDGKLQYAQAEIQEALEILQDMEQRHVIPPLKQIAGGGADSFDKDENWITGKYGGIYEWDSGAGKFEDSLSAGQSLAVGSYFPDLGSYQGGFSKIALGFSISKHAKDPRLCAEFISFLASDPDAVRLLGTERGVPLNRSAYETCDAAGLLADLSAQAYDRMNNWVTLRIDPSFEDASLKGVNGVYEDVFTGISYGDYSVSEGAERLYAGIQTALAGEHYDRTLFSGLSCRIPLL